MKKKRKILNKIEIARLIRAKSEKTIEQGKIIDLITVICLELKDHLVRDRSFSIPNFGVFALQSYPSQTILHVRTRESILVESGKWATFIPHVSFQNILSEKSKVLRKMGSAEIES